MRMPLVLTIRCLMGRALAISTTGEEIGVHRGLAAGELDYVGMAFVADDGVEHLFDLREGAELLALGAAGGVADGAAQVAVVADLDEGEAGVLLVVGAEAAVVGASPFDGSVVDLRHLGRLDEDFAAAAVVVDVVGDQDALGAVLGAALEQVDVAVLEDDLGVDLAVAGGADGEGDVVEEVGAGFGHGASQRGTEPSWQWQPAESYSKVSSRVWEGAGEVLLPQRTRGFTG